MTYNPTQDKSLFYQAAVKKGIGNIMINKRQIESVVMTDSLSATVKMVSGDVIEITIDATHFGELIHYLHQIGHSNMQEAGK